MWTERFGRVSDDLLMICKRSLKMTRLRASNLSVVAAETKRSNDQATTHWTVRVIGVCKDSRSCTCPLRAPKSIALAKLAMLACKLLKVQCNGRGSEDHDDVQIKFGRGEFKPTTSPASHDSECGTDKYEHTQINVGNIWSLHPTMSAQRIQLVKPRYSCNSCLILQLCCVKSCHMYVYHTNLIMHVCMYVCIYVCCALRVRVASIMSRR